jgi:hypothetical protein
LSKKSQFAPGQNDDSDHSEDSSLAQKPKKKEEEQTPLNRPIILVCNDGYAKALKPLKDIVLRIKVQETLRKRLFNRCWDIIKQESIDGVDHALVSTVVD